MLQNINGGEGGIRTHGTLARTPVFKTGALNHSATSPMQSDHRQMHDRRRIFKGAGDLGLAEYLDS